jgi:hypothetical protein
MTFAGISTSTAYALYRKPPNGIVLMMGAGIAGSIVDLGYGWTTACRTQVDLLGELNKERQQRNSSSMAAAAATKQLPHDEN